jgi:peptidoglycan/LPS O-acetylase OafA/YrhL
MQQETTITSVPAQRIPSLDGWRGIAILFVLFEHTGTALTGGYTRAWIQTGQHGVTIFFVLSGFLITSKLLDDPKNLKQFYIRRIFRLLPVAWAYLGALLLLDWLMGLHHASLAEVRACLLFYRNFAGLACGTAVAGHYWSLSVEEQFYLFWPCLLALAGPRRARWWVIVGALACAFYRWTHWAYYDRQWLSFHTEVRADALLVGCLLALLLQEPKMRSIIQRWSGICALPALLTLIACIARFHWLPPLYECVAIACLIAATTLNPNSKLVLPFSASPLVWLGTVSYSVYVWQQFFLSHYNSPLATYSMMFLMPFFALSSFYCIERPFTRLGHRLTDRMRQTAIAEAGGLRAVSIAIQ